MADHVNIVVMRRSSSLMPSLLLALLIFWGMSGRAFSAAFCQTLRCALPVQVAAPKPAAHSCCEEKQAKAKPSKESKENSRKGCCCKLDSFSGTVSKTDSLTIPGPLLIALPALSTAFAYAPAPTSVPAYFYSDSSPPIVALASVRDRAPPSA